MGINKELVVKNNNLYGLFINEKNTIHNIINDLHPNEISSRIRKHVHGNIFSYDSIKVFHSCFFDPAWLCLDEQVANPSAKFVCSPLDFTNRKLIEPSEFRPDEFFPGAFTYHLHLSGTGFNIVNQSYFEYFEEYFFGLLKLKTDDKMLLKPI